ncbi:uncharacterized protein AMSG_05013 [Thecamonas trahens ATCC 50062]|uniref:PCI domain-containing protein n=1 Tax=Thecamonas trahens ATCC 50062 TaxID=461836 RepID=A0A0L0D9N6_THETB|nr:hypothetical protein AMSG_05013 [Thecamonas trahens ATCC 50062]KNC49054.1 hypothetical protein AMSG_05013 [Thecamonas trahens ATCC 50062]|eukprot:XP_013758087.1 hypothetical protein AMSG_05013 [Thecamonas trahens ATCC 50062]
MPKKTRGKKASKSSGKKGKKSAVQARKRKKPSGTKGSLADKFAARLSGLNKAKGASSGDGENAARNPRKGQRGGKGTTVFVKRSKNNNGSASGFHFAGDDDGHDEDDNGDDGNNDDGGASTEEYQRNNDGDDDDPTKRAVFIPVVPDESNYKGALVRAVTKCGKVVDIFPKFGKSKKSAIIVFETAASAREAIASVTSIGGVPIKVSQARSVPSFDSASSSAPPAATMLLPTMTTETTNASHFLQSTMTRTASAFSGLSGAGSSDTGPSSFKLRATAPAFVPSAPSALSAPSAPPAPGSNPFAVAQPKPTPTSGRSLFAPPQRKHVARSSREEAPFATQRPSAAASAALRATPPAAVVPAPSTLVKIRDDDSLTQERAAERAKRFASVGEAEARYKKLNVEVVRKREEAKAALVHGTDVRDAAAIVGTCPDMCPEHERLERYIRNDLLSFEKIPGTNTIDHSAVMKKFHRPAAGDAPPLPEEVRPHPVLRRTMDYVLAQVIDSTARSFAEVHAYVRDRTRSIRQDYNFQAIASVEAAEVLEQIVRFHILSEHRCCEEPIELFDSQQNMEQFSKCITDLFHMYRVLRYRGETPPNEAEFRAYGVLSRIDSPEALLDLLTLPAELLASPDLAFALDVVQAFKTGNYAKFFNLVRSTTYLNACLIHKFFNPMRSVALRTMNRAYRSVAGPIAGAKVVDPIPVEYLVGVLGFETETEAIAFLQHHGLAPAEVPATQANQTSRDYHGQVCVFFGTDSLVHNSSKFPVSCSHVLIESKLDPCATNALVISGVLPRHGEPPLDRAMLQKHVRLLSRRGAGEEDQDAIAAARAANSERRAAAAAAAREADAVRQEQARAAALALENERRVARAKAAAEAEAKAVEAKAVAARAKAAADAEAAKAAAVAARVAAAAEAKRVAEAAAAERAAAQAAAAQAAANKAAADKAAREATAAAAARERALAAEAAASAEKLRREAAALAAEEQRLALAREERLAAEAAARELERALVAQREAAARRQAAREANLIRAREQRITRGLFTRWRSMYETCARIRSERAARRAELEARYQQFKASFTGVPLSSGLFSAGEHMSMLLEVPGEGESEGNEATPPVTPARTGKGKSLVRSGTSLLSPAGAGGVRLARSQLSAGSSFREWEAASASQQVLMAMRLRAEEESHAFWCALDVPSLVAKPLYEAFLAHVASAMPPFEAGVKRSRAATPLLESAQGEDGCHVRAGSMSEHWPLRGTAGAASAAPATVTLGFKVVVAARSSPHESDISSWLAGKLAKSASLLTDQLDQLSPNSATLTAPLTAYGVAASELGREIESFGQAFLPQLQTHETKRALAEVLRGTTCLVFVLHTSGDGDDGSSDEDDDAEATETAERERLHALVAGLAPQAGAALLVLYASDAVQAESGARELEVQAEMRRVARVLELGSLPQAQVGAWRIQPYNELQAGDPKQGQYSVCTLQAGLKWAAEYGPAAPPLALFSLGELIDHYVSVHVDEVLSRPALTLEHGIGMFNGVLDALASLLTDDRLGAYDWPAPEYAPDAVPPLEWNAPGALATLGSVLSALKLPDLGRVGTAYVPSDGSTMQVTSVHLEGLAYAQPGLVSAFLSDYASALAAREHESPLLPLALVSMRTALQHALRAHFPQALGGSGSGRSTFVPSVELGPLWAMFMRAVVEHRLEQLPAEVRALPVYHTYLRPPLGPLPSSLVEAHVKANREPARTPRRIPPTVVGPGVLGKRSAVFDDELGDVDVALQPRTPMLRTNSGVFTLSAAGSPVATPPASKRRKPLSASKAPRGAPGTPRMARSARKLRAATGSPQLRTATGSSSGSGSDEADLSVDDLFAKFMRRAHKQRRKMAESDLLLWSVSESKLSVPS